MSEAGPKKRWTIPTVIALGGVLGAASFLAAPDNALTRLWASPTIPPTTTSTTLAPTTTTRAEPTTTLAPT
ncbi:MAG TPA: hypothetical protein VHL55_04480, partial [Acidimicrobiia bacterium]|nr:hypothetical protein [Acidimicrobiia bacterium]